MDSFIHCHCSRYQTDAIQRDAVRAGLISWMCNQLEVQLPGISVVYKCIGWFVTPLQPLMPSSEKKTWTTLNCVELSTAKSLVCKANLPDSMSWKLQRFVQNRRNVMHWMKVANLRKRRKPWLFGRLKWSWTLNSWNKRSIELRNSRKIDTRSSLLQSCSASTDLWVLLCLCKFHSGENSTWTSERNGRRHWKNQFDKVFDLGCRSEDCLLRRCDPCTLQDFRIR